MSFGETSCVLPWSRALSVSRMRGKGAAEMCSTEVGNPQSGTVALVHPLQAKILASPMDGWPQTDRHRFTVVRTRVNSAPERPTDGPFRPKFADFGPNCQTSGRCRNKLGRYRLNFGQFRAMPIPVPLRPKLAEAGAMQIPPCRHHRQSVWSSSCSCQT